MTVLDMVNKLSRSMRRSGKGRGHHRGGFRILRILFEQGPMDFAELAEELDIRSSSLSEALDRLQQREMITRTPHESDKRKVVVELTEAAKEKMEARKDKKDEQLVQITSVLTEAEQAEFIRLSQKIIDALSEQSQ